MARVPFVVVYRRPRGRKYFMKVLYMDIEHIIDANKRKPPIPHENELVEIGWGLSYVDKWKEEYKIKEIDND